MRGLHFRVTCLCFSFFLVSLTWITHKSSSFWISSFRHSFFLINPSMILVLNLSLVSASALLKNSTFLSSREKEFPFRKPTNVNSVIKAIILYDSNLISECYVKLSDVAYNSYCVATPHVFPYHISNLCIT